MPTRTGKQKGQRVGKNKDGQEDVRILQTQITGSDDNQEIEMFSQSCLDICPADGDKIYSIPLGGESTKISIVTKDLITPTVEPGEIRAYSHENQSVKAEIHIKKDGSIVITGDSIEILGNSNSAVAFAALQTAFDQLKADFDAHSHLYNPGPGSPTQTGIPTPSTADITPAEVPEVKLP